MRGRDRSATARLALCLTLCLATAAACSGQSGSTGKRPKVAFLIPSSPTAFFVRDMVDGFRSGVKQIGGVDQVIDGPPNADGQRQVQIFQDLIKTNKDGISVFTLSPDLLAQPMAAAEKSGIPLIAVDNPAPPSSNVKLFIGNDNTVLGQQLADEMITKLAAGATGKIVIGTSQPGLPVLDKRASGMRAEIRKKLPGVSVVGPFDSGWEPGTNLAAWTTLVKANPTALAFMGTGEVDGYNLAAIRRSTKGKWLAAAFDLSPNSMRAVESGDLLLVSPEHFVKGAIAGRLQAQHAKDGKPLPEGWLYTPGLAVNQTNIDAIIARQATIEAREAYFAPEIDKILSDKSYLRPMSQVS